MCVGEAQFAKLLHVEDSPAWLTMRPAACAQMLFATRAILEYMEHGLYTEHIVVLSKIIFYLLQDGCKPVMCPYLLQRDLDHDPREPYHH